MPGSEYHITEIHITVCTFVQDSCKAEYVCYV
jgi:hypothetical protein